MPRPSDYKQTYCNECIEHLAQGYSLASFAGVVGAHRSTLYDWAEAHEEFAEAIEIGRAKGQCTWEERLANQAQDGKGNTAAIIFAMKNLYQDDWRDRHEHTGADGGPFQVVLSSDDQKVL